ncbi:MAG: MATE family efflux transporter [Actinobacteria bacterium]|nr:MATE family efflux transporter [Cyanobacteriota bacterium]MCL5771212.1 MATE family efflux transporter [Actinomycetota bacterium]
MVEELSKYDIKRNEILTKSIPKLLIRFSLATTIGTIVSALYNIVDTIFVGKAVNSIAIAGLSIVLPIQLIMLGIANMVGVGAASVISRSLGSNDKRNALDAFATAIIINLIFNIIFIICGFIFLDKLLILFGASKNILPYARDYIKIILPGFIIFSFSLSSVSFIRAEGYPRAAIYPMLIGLLSNIIFNTLFVFIIPLGVKGVAYGTVISQFLSSLYIICYIFLSGSIYKGAFKRFYFKFSLFKEIIFIGFPSLIGNIAGGIIIIIFNKLLFHYGNELYVATMGIGLRIMSLIQLPLIGFVQGFTTIASFNYGANQFLRVKKAIITVFLWTFGLSTLEFLIIMIFPGFIMRLFSNDPKLIEVSIYPLRAVNLFLPLICIQLIGASLFQAIGKAISSLIISISRQFLFLIPLIFILPLFLGIHGIWISLPIADFMSIILSIVLIYKQVLLFNKTELELT